MRESQDKNTFPEVEDVVRRESEEALRRFRSGDFAARLKANPDSSPARRSFFPFRKPVFVPALGVLVLAAGALIVFILFDRDRERSRLEAGFRHMTESLSHSDAFRSGGQPVIPGGSGEMPATGDVQSFAKALCRAAAGSEAGSQPESIAPAEGGTPLRPLFSPEERFKILYEEKVILRVLENITNQKEV